MAKRFTKPSINWAELEKRVPKDQKGKFLAFKAKADNYYRKVIANPEEAPIINWEEYKKIVPVPGLVDQFREKYTAFKVPYPTDTLSSQIDAQWSALQGEIKDFATEMQKYIADAKKGLDHINSLPKYEEMTMEMYADMFPEDALDPVNKPSFWPHNPEEQPGYLTPEQKAMKESGGGHH